METKNLLLANLATKNGWRKFSKPKGNGNRRLRTLERKGKEGMHHNG
jgi:hypothetical protein